MHIDTSTTFVLRVNTEEFRLITRALRRATPKEGELIDHRYVTVPHPSGLCRFWNDPGAVRDLRRALADKAGVESIED